MERIQRMKEYFRTVFYPVCKKCNGDMSDIPIYLKLKRLFNDLINFNCKIRKSVCSKCYNDYLVEEAKLKE